MSDTDINSHDYWNGRFEKDWESNMGKEQSRFFAKVALENLPPWMRSTAGKGGWTICDWGCAQGDGTDVIASYFSRERVIGIDFAESAVKKARDAYPGIRFDAQDWLASEAVGEKFNCIFSSNTLEHFEDPFKVLATLFQRAEQCVALALPYRELDRIPEHFFSFTPENIPLIAHPDWILVHARAVDCREMSPTYWHGDQIILVYANRAWIESSNLVLADCFLNAGIADTVESRNARTLDSLQQENSKLSDLMIEIKARLDEQSRLHVDLLDKQSRLQVELRDENRQLEAANKELLAELTKIKTSSSWRITSPLRLLVGGVRKILKN
ncbi:methyltransferase domain-containing protein [Achromobacter sp. KK8]|jgi:hypothetical protein